MRRVTAAAACLLLTTFVSWAPATAAASASRPFHATLTSPTTPAPPPQGSGCASFFTSTQSGIATHLGAFTGVGTTCAYPFRMVMSDPPVAPDGGAPYLVADFSVAQTWTAANGDELRTSGTGVLVISLQDGSTALRGTGTFDGGTGRFLRVDGEVVVTGRNGVVHEAGWIRYDARAEAE